ncbi:MAG: matrixin family metalloprotease [Bryobacterales bacterium]|nr:matrixin family metalloprotease [Bryobacterales bacterium]
MSRPGWTSVLLAVMACSPALPYGHFVEYSTRTAPFRAIPQKYNVGALPDRSLPVFVAESAVSTMPRESLASVLNLVRDGVNVWDRVPSSALRVTFGGLRQSGLPAASPAVQIEFDELDPLTLGITYTTTVDGEPAGTEQSPFRPIANAFVRLNQDLRLWEGNPNRYESLFLTIVHELGHALGLQHTFTASAMATEVTRATSWVRPLEADDIAGISELYPVDGYAARHGAIAGRIVFDDTLEGVHLASVVAISPSGSAVSALTDPGGFYRIAGLTPGTYQLYVHPLPASGRTTAAGDIAFPLSADGVPLPPSAPFATVFFAGGQGVTDPLLGSYLTVAAGSTVGDVNLPVTRRAIYPFSPVTLYSFFGQQAVRPGFVDTSSNGISRMVAVSRGLASNNLPAPGLRVSFLGGTPVLAGLSAYAGETLIIDISATSTFGGVGPRHAVFALSGDIYVRPNAIRLVAGGPPRIEQVTVRENGARRLAVTGQRLSAATAFFLDGVRAPVAGREEGGTILLDIPPGLSNHRAILTAANPDGQNSMFVQSADPPAHVYGFGEPGSIRLAPSQVPAGTDTLVEIIGAGTGFVPGLTSLGVGSPEVRIRGMWVTGPDRILANVAVAGQAAPGAYTAIALTGSQAAVRPFALDIGTASAAPRLDSRLRNADPAQRVLFPGAEVILTGANIGVLPVVILNETPLSVLETTETSARFRIPASTAVGFHRLRVENGLGATVVGLDIGPPPPEILTVSPAPPEAFRAGDGFAVTVSGLSSAEAGDLAGIRLLVGGVPHAVLAADPVEGTAAWRLEATLLPDLAPGNEVHVAVTVGGRTSRPVVVTVAAP